jgi:hypothetical protein
MGSCKPPKTAFNDADLNDLEWVFEAVCAALKGRDLTEDNKAFLRRRLFMLACNGMTDPDVLREHLIASFARQNDIAGTNASQSALRIQNRAAD